MVHACPRARGANRRGAAVLSALVAMLAATTRAATVDVELRATRLDGTQFSGELLAVEPALTLSGEAEARIVAWDALLEVVCDQQAPTATAPASAAGPIRVLLSDGSAFETDISTAADAGLALVFPDGASRSMRRVLVRSIERTDAPAAALDEFRREANAERDADLAVVARGAKQVVLRGACEAIDADRVQFDWKGRSIEIPLQRLVGLSLHNALDQTPAFLVHLRSGAMLGARTLGGDTERLTLGSSTFGAMDVAWSQIERIEINSKRRVFLSMLEPVGYAYQPLFDNRFEYGVNRDLYGHPIELRGDSYEYGIVMHSASRLAYDLGGQYARLLGKVGILDTVGDLGDATVRVRGDGRELFVKERVRGGRPLIDLDVDVQGVRFLELVVEYGEDIDLGDHVAWADVRLIR